MNVSTSRKEAFGVPHSARFKVWSGKLARFVRSQPLGSVGAFLLLLTTVVAVLTPVIAPYDPLAMDTKSPHVAPGTRYLLGTDGFGRDVLSRILYGSRISLYVGFLSVGIGTGAGAVLGLLGGYLGGKVDLITQRVLDGMMAFPAIVLALVIMSALGSSLNNVVIAIAIVFLPKAARIVRSSALSIRETQYVEAARAAGAGEFRIAFLHVLPNCLAPWFVFATGALGQAIVTEATLSFLGLGTPPPIPSWGSMISGEARSMATVAPWLAIFPGLALSVTVYGLNLFGDSLRDVLDPRLR